MLNKHCFQASLIHPLSAYLSVYFPPYHSYVSERRIKRSSGPHGIQILMSDIPFRSQDLVVSYIYQDQ